MAVPQRPQIAFPQLTSVVKKLIIGLFAAYVLQLVLAWVQDFELAPLLALTPGSPAIWQLATYVLVHRDDPVMFLLGLLFLWWALSPFEMAFGPKRTLQLSAVLILAGALPVWLLGFVIAGPVHLLYGTSPLWFGGITASTWPQRHRQLSLFGLFSMTGQQLLMVLVVLAVLMFLWSRNYTFLIADLCAMGAAIGFINWMARPQRTGRVRRAAPRHGFKVIKGGNDDDERPKYLN